MLHACRVVLCSALALRCAVAHAAGAVTISPFTVFQATTNPDGSAFGFPVASDQTNYLFGLQVADATAHDHVEAQLVSHSGAPIGAPIDTGRTGGVPFAGFDGTNYLMVWDDSGVYGDGISGQLVSRSGALMGSPIDIARPSEVSAAQLGLSGLPVIFDGSNYFIVFNTGHSGDAVDIYGVFVSPAGTRLGNIVPIVTAPHQQRDYSLAFDGTNLLVVWVDGQRQVQNGADLCTGEPQNLPADIFGQFVQKSAANAPGALVGSDFTVNQSDFPSDVFPPSVAFDGTNYLVIWGDQTVGDTTCVDGKSSGARAGIYGQLISTSGVAVEGVITIATTDNNNREIGSLAFGEDNYVVVATVLNDTTNGADIHGQFLSRTGALLGSNFVITNAPQDQFFAGVGFAGGQFVTGWISGVLRNPGSVVGAFVQSEAPTPSATASPTITPTATPTPVTALLTRDIAATDTTIPVDDITLFPDRGTVEIDGERMTYDGKEVTGSADSFGADQPPHPGVLLHVIRGVDGTVPAAHAPGATVTLVRICVGDCNASHDVTVDEIIDMVNIALGNADVGSCDAGDANHDQQVTIDEILTAVNNALSGC